jgi:transposase
LKVIDESGVNRAMTRLSGRAPRGERARGAVPRHDGPHVTMVGAWGMQGLPAVRTVEGAPDAEGFLAEVEPGLAPSLPPGDVVVMDNWRAHKVAGGHSAIATPGAHVRYWPPYSPDLAPIEPGWSKLTPSPRKAKARTRAALDIAISGARATITASDAQGWFQPCGYASQ